MRVTIGNFGGLVPRLSAHNLSAISASIAHDVKLRNGRLEAWKDTCDFQDVSFAAHSFYVYGCCPVAWNSIVYATEFAPDWGRLYLTGRTTDAEVAVFDCNCNPTYYKLGVPPPPAPLYVFGVEQCGRESDARTYVYTYVNQWGEESAPSPASNRITVADGSYIQVYGILPPPAGYGITHANIYRAATGFRPMDGKNQKPLTAYMYVATVPVPEVNSYADTIRMTGLGPALNTDKVCLPPAGLTNIVSIEGVDRLAGTVKNRIYLTEVFQPHNWPVKYELTLDSTIIHMGCLDQKLYVTTDTTPYVVDVSSCEDVKCTPVLDTGRKLPDISCGHSSSAVMTPHGFVYSSPLGLILIDPTAKFHILTARWFSEDDWALVRPDTVRLAYWEGFIFCVTGTVTFLLNIDGDPYGDMHGAELSTLSDSPVDLRVDSIGKLMFLENGKISIWNHGTKYRPFTWVSRELTGGDTRAGDGQMPDNAPPLGCTWSPVSAKIRSEDTEFTLITPVRPEAYKRKVLRETPFRLPRVGRHMWYKVRLRGTYPVEFVDLGTSHFTVNQGA